MIVPSDVRRSYDFNLPYVEQVEHKVRDIVFGFCERNGYAYVGRRKELDSLAEKLESGRYDSWDKIDDIFGCSIVIPHLEKESSVIEFLNSKFTCVELRKRGQTKKSPDTFRFDATRYIGSLRTESSEAHPIVSALMFEVQIRSAFEHAWSVSMHSIVYKTDEIDWKRKRLSAQIKATVEQMDQLIVAFETAKSPIVESAWPEIEILKKISSSFLQLQGKTEIPEELIPSSWGRFSENIYSLLRSSKSWPRQTDQQETYVNGCLETIEEKFVEMKHFPRSISLFQLVFGVLWEGKKVVPNLKRFVPLVTSELEEIFPSVVSCKRRFKFSDAVTGRVNRDATPPGIIEPLIVGNWGILETRDER
ncbi:hypothetical protein Pla52o_39170 [Novipirellula galeiformis]|uniref:RelA/SpoT domain-containing protein n=1 Tax=Novipirellula galeiformis TaxID=2528004 RepID=A0A5C6CAV2_9BACT|nr:hypothetical protein [Novipirellula galeiformis]TWU21730.1 hypothetical protein Pla52o_39170 [Novipirellula galeiformis]